MVRTISVQIWLLALLFFVSLGISAHATHHWSSYHRADGTINRYYFPTGYYDEFYEDEAFNDSDSWHNASVVNFPTSTSHYFGCLDEVGGFDGSYGNTGWDGLTTLDCVDGTLIKSSYSQINRTYADSYSDDNKHKVACHELGHAVGLWHNDVSDTCMRPSATSGVSNPNTHDIEMLASIY